ncbi:dolichol-phosphate mannosyltransferase [Aquisalinus flavus]|uniref:Dolichol-phosphate mannosyltransferase n=1 Tax=Aquisalinus flavus TaxID=1526572 RepID=A0A8J2V363_9PROT|nr:glycosyltransferase family 2 protein [Aquisalinus flavus]GGD18927.1 dolichol-phosphate mannosyltransferase [Aquisalinus flavus]
MTSDPVPAPLYAVDKSMPADGPALSVVIPMFNEEGNAATLVGEVADALRPFVAFEIVIVNDASRDGTLEVLKSLKRDYPELRIVQHHNNAGQSRSVRTGVLAARAPVIATLDGDGQNNPADIPALYEKLMRNGAPDLLAMVAGERQGRKDTQAKKVASRLANGIRKKLLNDEASDTGCGLKVFYRGVFLRLPYFDHVHRYLPALVRREGLIVEFAPVSARERLTGQSKYTNLQRAAVAIRDLIGVTWLIARSRKPGEISEL